MAIAFIAGYTPSTRTNLRRQSNVRSSVSAAGTLRFLDLGAQTYYVGKPEYTALTEAEKETLVDWLVTNETAEIDFVIGSETYRGYIQPTAPINQKVMNKTSHLWTVSFSFLGVKQ